MLMAAANALANNAPIVLKGEGALLPSLGDIQDISRQIAFDVARQAQTDGVALTSSDEIIQANIEKNFWQPRYRAYRRKAF